MVRGHTRSSASGIAEAVHQVPVLHCFGLQSRSGAHPGLDWVRRSLDAPIRANRMPPFDSRRIRRTMGLADGGRWSSPVRRSAWPYIEGRPDTTMEAAPRAT
jgi:hypothetical protein